jgi:hypothetical protein
VAVLGVWYTSRTESCTFGMCWNMKNKGEEKGAMKDFCVFDPYSRRGRPLYPLGSFYGHSARFFSCSTTHVEKKECREDGPETSKITSTGWRVDYKHGAWRAFGVPRPRYPLHQRKKRAPFSGSPAIQITFSFPRQQILPHVQVEARWVMLV